MILQLTEEQIRILKEETKDRYPSEVCGLLFGDIDGRKAIVKRIAVLQNILESATRFQIDPEAFVEALSEAEKNGMQLIGFFHSHPAPAYPSPNDVEYMKLWPENIWLIISSIDYNVAAYQTVNGEPRRIDIEVSDKC